jgi:lipoic acid synthetase
MNNEQNNATRPHLPPWFKQKLPRAGEEDSSERLLHDLGLHTICESGRCPNVSRCFPGGAAFLILGNTCTRGCAFCAVNHGATPPVDIEEPARLSEAARRLKLDYIFITSVTRDDLPDGGAGHFARTIRRLHDDLPGIKVEVLVPDFQGDGAAIRTVQEAGPVVFGHNVETVPRLYGKVRPKAGYRRSLEVLKQAKEMAPDILTKSGLMLGLGETKDEVLEVMRDLREAGCDLFTLGQYLSPSRQNYPVQSFPTPEEYAAYVPLGLEMGFRAMASAPCGAAPSRPTSCTARPPLNPHYRCEASPPCHCFVVFLSVIASPDKIGATGRDDEAISPDCNLYLFLPL